MDHNKILGVVLAGGKSQRFGEDKSQAKLGEKILIDYILSELIDEFNEILIVANDPIKHLPSNKIKKIKDFKKDLGPLGGIFTAMKWAKDNNINLDLSARKYPNFFQSIIMKFKKILFETIIKVPWKYRVYLSSLIKRILISY